jgi:hypothetical protein
MASVETEKHSKYSLRSANSGNLSLNQNGERVGWGEDECQFALEFQEGGNERHCIAKKEE